MSPQHLPPHKYYSDTQLNATYSRWTLHIYSVAGDLLVNYTMNAFPLWASVFS